LYYPAYFYYGDKDMTNEKEETTQWSRDNKDEVLIWFIKRVIGLLVASIWRLKLLGMEITRRTLTRSRVISAQVF
jgi:hypothetical protein